MPSAVVIGKTSVSPYRGFGASRSIAKMAIPPRTSVVTTTAGDGQPFHGYGQAIGERDLIWIAALHEVDHPLASCSL
jgi:hypothetical protein